MPPKKDSKVKKSRPTTVINGVYSADMSKEDIESYIIVLREELDREKGERNLAIMEREKITTFWELTKKQLEDSRSLLNKKDKELEDSDERHQLEMNVYKQKVKHLMFERNTRETEIKEDFMCNLSNSQVQAKQDLRAIRHENYALKAKLRNQQIESEEAIRMLKRQNEIEVADLRAKFAQQIEDIENRAAKQMSLLRDEIDNQRRIEVHATEEDKNAHIQTIEADHAHAFAEMKSYYNDVTLGNVSIIKTLRENIDELRLQLARSQRLLDSSQVTLDSKSDSLSKMTKENSRLNQIATLYEREKIAHALTKSNAKKDQLAMQKLESRFDILQARFEGLDKMRSQLAHRFESMLIDIQQRMGLREMIVEQKLGQVAAALETRESQVMQLVMAMNSDPISVEQARSHLESLLKIKNTTIQDLQYEVMRMAKAYTELWSTCQQKMVDELNAPTNLGIQPVQVKVKLSSAFNPATALGSKMCNPDLVGTTGVSTTSLSIGRPAVESIKVGYGPSGFASVKPT